MTKNFFTKEDYTEEDIISLISNGIEESASLEFKGFEAIKNSKEIAKDVSAFANSGGGIIIYGIEEKDHKAHALSFVDGNKSTKERLDQIISTSIEKRIPNLTIYPIRFENKIEQTIYIVKIPESPLAPHMSGKKYYRRFNFTSQPMEEYEVRNSYFKSQIPTLKLSPCASSFVSSIYQDDIHYTNFHIENTGNIIEHFLKLEIRISKENYSKFSYETSFYNPKQDYLNPLEKFKRYTGTDELTFIISKTEPIFPNEIMKLGETFLKFKIRNDEIAPPYLLKKNILKLKLFYTGGVLEKEYTLTELILNYEIAKHQNEKKSTKLD